MINKRENMRIPDCVTETRHGNTILIVHGFHKEGGRATAVDVMMRALDVEVSAQQRANAL